MRNSNNPGRARVDLTDPYLSAGADVQRDSKHGTKLSTSSGATDATTPRDLASVKLRSNAKGLAQQYAENEGGTTDYIDGFMQAFKASPQGEQFFMPRYNMNNPQNA